jgi:hypothetical protein
MRLTAKGEIKNPDGNITTRQLGMSHYDPFPNIYEKNN